MSKFLDYRENPLAVGDWVESPPNASDPIIGRIHALYFDWVAGSEPTALLLTPSLLGATPKCADCRLLHR